MLRFAEQHHALLYFGLFGTLFLALGLERAAWVANRFREERQLAVGGTILSVLFTIVGTLTLYTSIILYSIQAVLQEAVQRDEWPLPQGRELPGNAPAVTLLQILALEMGLLVAALALTAGIPRGLRRLQQQQLLDGFDLRSALERARRRAPKPSLEPGREPQRRGIPRFVREIRGSALERRMISAGLVLALLRAVRLVSSVPHLEGALTVVEPLLLTWPFLTLTLQHRAADLALGSALYALALAYGGLWRASTHGGGFPPFPAESQVLWSALTLASVAASQLLLWRQRLLILRGALALLAGGAVLTALGIRGADPAMTSLALLLVLVQFYWSTRATAGGQEQVTGHEPDTEQEPDPRATTSVQHPGPVLASADQLYEKQQLLSMRLASIVAFDPPSLPALLTKMLELALGVLEADVAALLVVHFQPTTALVLVRRVDVTRPYAPVRPSVVYYRQIPALDDALHRGERLLYDGTEGTPGLEALYQTLGEATPGPTMVQPILYQEQRLGLVVVGNPHSGKLMTQESEGRLCETLAARLAPLLARQLGLADTEREVRKATDQPDPTNAHPAMSSSAS